jgi:hypothetical protein
MARFWGKPRSIKTGGPEPPTVQAICVPATLLSLRSNPSNMIDFRYCVQRGRANGATQDRSDARAAMPSTSSRLHTAESVMAARPLANRHRDRYHRLAVTSMRAFWVRLPGNHPPAMRTRGVKI